jgi:hypothetical protein
MRVSHNNSRIEITSEEIRRPRLGNSSPFTLAAIFLGSVRPQLLRSKLINSVGSACCN